MKIKNLTTAVNTARDHAIEKRTRQKPENLESWEIDHPDEEEDVFDKGTQEIIRDAILKGGIDQETAIDVAKKLGASLLARWIYSETRDFLRELPGKIRNAYQDRRLLKIKLPGEQVAKWLVTHAHEQGYKEDGGSSDLEALVDDSVEYRNEFNNREGDSLRGQDLVKLIPSTDTDTTQFVYKDDLFEISREYPSKNNIPNKKASAYRGKPKYYLKTWTGSKDNVKSLLREASVAAFNRTKEVVKIHRMTNFGDWRSQGFSEGMKLDSLVLENGQKEEIVGAMDSFLEDREFCAKHGTPWRVGFLLEGPHGTGKTSTVRALAHRYEMDLYEVNVCSADMDDGTLKRAMSRIGKGDIALVEDVDAVYDDESNVTPKGFSVAIDGVAEQPGRVLFMTTNNAHVLDDRLTRPGRVDHTFRFGLATEGMARRLFLKFNPERHSMARNFAEALGDRNYSPAAIQNHFTKFRTAEEAMNNIGEIRPPGGEHKT